MLLIFEGPDWAGKSFFAKQLANRLCIPVYKPDRTPLHGQSVEQSQGEDLGSVDLLMHLQADTIMDRWYPSEYAYGRALEREFDEELFWHIDGLVAKHCSAGEAIVPVMLRHPLATEGGCTLPEDARRDSDTDSELVTRVNGFYGEYLEKSRVPWLQGWSDEDDGAMIEAIMRRVTRFRPNRDHVYMQMARVAAQRSTCLSRRNGAVLLSASGHVIATGYNGVIAGAPHPSVCPRLTAGTCSGSDLEACEDVHSEENLIAQAAQLGHSVTGGTVYTLNSPCQRCFRMLAAAGIREIVYEQAYGDVRALSAGVEGIKIRRLS